MNWLIITLVAGLPFANFIFQKLNVWQAQGCYFQCLLLFCYALSFFQKSERREIKNIPLGFLFLWVSSLTLWNIQKLLTTGKLDANQMLTYFNFLVMILFYKICVQYLNKDMISKGIKILSYVFIGHLLYSVVQWFGLDQFYIPIANEHPVNLYPVVGFIGNTTHFSAYCGMMLPLLFIQKPRVICLSVILLYLIICFTTGYAVSGIPLTGILVATLTLFFCLFKLHKRLLLGIILLFCILGARYYFSLTPQERIIFTSSSLRVRNLELYREDIKETFVTGRGVGITHSLAKVKGNTFNQFQHLHNEYLQAILEIGFIGLILIISCFYNVFSLRIKSKEGIILKAILLGFCIQAFTLFPAHLWVMTSIMVFAYSALYVIKEEEWEQLKL